MLSNETALRLAKKTSAFALIAAFSSNVAFAQAPAAKSEAAAKPASTKAEAKTTKADAKATTKADAKAAEPAAAPASPADEARLKAGDAFTAGRTAFDAGDYVTAEAKFREAEALLPSPFAELYIAQCLDKQGKDAATVVAAYDNFLLNPATGRMDPAKVREADERAAELRKGLPAKYTFTTEPAGATVMIDGVKQEGVTPLTVELAPGKHSLEVTHEGFEKTVAEIDVAGGVVIEQPVNLTPVAAAAPAAAPVEEKPKEERSMVPAYVTLGLSGAGLIAGTVFGILALDSKSKYDETPTTELADETERNAIIADMSFGLAITLGITGAVLLTSGDADAATPATTAKVSRPGDFRITPYASPLGAGAAARLTF